MSTQPQEIRDTLFGDMPLAAWPTAGGNVGDAQPWKTFVDARMALANGDTEAALVGWRQVTEMPGLEPRHYLQAWHFLRAHGVKTPADKEKQLLGVVIEVPMNGGLDLLAAYADLTARFYHHAGGGIAWDHPNETLDPFIHRLLGAGQHVLNAIGPWEKARPGIPQAGQLRINFLSPAGLHFGQGPFTVLMKDPMAKGVMDAGVMLMQEMIKLKPPGK